VRDTKDIKLWGGDENVELGRQLKSTFQADGVVVTHLYNGNREDTEHAK
jgi:hypothetical protein